MGAGSVSVTDEPWAKLGFYADHDVNELLIVDPEQREIHWLGLGSDGEYRPIERSTLLALSVAELAGRIKLAVEARRALVRPLPRT